MSNKRKFKRNMQRTEDAQIEGYIQLCIQMGLMVEKKEGQYALTEKGVRYSEWLIQNNQEQNSIFTKLVNRNARTNDLSQISN